MPYSSTTERPLTLSIIILFLVNSRSITSLTVCLNGSDLTCHTVANVLGSVSSFPPGKHLAAVCPRGPDSVPCRL